MQPVSSKLTFNKTYFIWTIILFIIEVLIAIYVKDKFVRPYVGDFLVVILIYCFLKSFLKETPLKVGIAVLIFSFVVEFLQYFNFINLIGLGDNELARIVIGTSFQFGDLVAYFLGILFVLGIEYYRSNRGSL